MGVEESAGGNIKFSEHVDIAIVMLLLIALFVFALGGAGRAAGNKFGIPGVTAFFGG